MFLLLVILFLVYCYLLSFLKESVHDFFLDICTLPCHNECQDNVLKALDRLDANLAVQLMVLNSLLSVQLFITLDSIVKNAISCNSIFKYRLYLVNKLLPEPCSVSFIQEVSGDSYCLLLKVKHQAADIDSV